MKGVRKQRVRKEMKLNHEEKKMTVMAVCAVVCAALLIGACGNTENQEVVTNPTTDIVSVLDDTPDVSTESVRFGEYVGCIFSGKDPWDGDLTITIDTIDNGYLKGTYRDAIGDVVMECELNVPIDEHIVPFEATGFVDEEMTQTFHYSGRLAFTEYGQLRVIYEGGELGTFSNEGDSSAYHIDALEESARAVILMQK